MSVKGMHESDMNQVDVEDGMVERFNSVNGLNDLEMFEKERVDERKMETSGIEDGVIKNKLILESVEENTVKPAIEIKTPPNVKTEAKNDDIKIRRVDSERAGIERLAAMERLAEKERQAKIKRREELDRVARLQRVLALVRTPQLDSVKKTKAADNLRELGVVTDMNLRVDHLGVTDKQLSEVKPVVDEAQLTNKKRIDDYVGIEKLERMSKQERILEIDRLIYLEHEAEAKRQAEIERITKLEREAELERVTKMNQLVEIDLKAELEKAEKERLVEVERQEKMKRREELDRVEKLQRVLVMERASETDRVAEMKQAELERSAEMKRREELKLLEELGILPRQQLAENDTVTEVKPVEELKPVKPEAGMNLFSGINTITAVKGAITEMKEVNEENAVKEVETTTVEQSTKKESESNKEIMPEDEKDPKIKFAAESRPGRKKVREELDRVANLQRIIAMVRNTEPGDVAYKKQYTKVEKATDLKYTDEINFLEELGILPKENVAQKEITENLKPIEELNLKQILPDKNENVVKQMNMATDVKRVAEIKEDVEVDAVPNVEQLAKKQTETKIGMEAESEREAKIKHAAEMERKARTDREARMKRREELDRVANLQRVVALVPNEEFDHIADIKQAELERTAEKNRKKDIRVLEELGIISKTEVAQRESEINKQAVSKWDKTTNVTNATVVKEFNRKTDVESPESLSERQIVMEQMTIKRMAKQDQKSLAELRVAQMKRVAELGREMKTAKVDERLEEREKQMTETEHTKTNVKDLKNIDEKQLELKLPGVKREAGADFVSGIRRKEDVNPMVDLKEENPKMTESVIEIKPKEDEPEVKQEGVKSEKELISFASRLAEVKRESEFRFVESKRLREMKRLVVERVIGRDCEWDGQMMYVGREPL